MNTHEQFNDWLADMADALDRFHELIPEAVQAKLDYSPASLDILEQWLLSRYSTIDEILAPELLEWHTRQHRETYCADQGRCLVAAESDAAQTIPAQIRRDREQATAATTEEQEAALIAP